MLGHGAAHVIHHACFSSGNKNAPVACSTSAYVAGHMLRPQAHAIQAAHDQPLQATMPHDLRPLILLSVQEL